MRDLTEHEIVLLDHIERLETERYLALREGVAAPNEDRGVPKRLRFEILRRDKFTCQYCGASAPAVPLHVDHVIPISRGGSNAPSNLVAACETCNTGKHTTEMPAEAVSFGDALHQYGEAEDALRLAKIEWRRAGFDTRAIGYLLAIRRCVPGSSDWIRATTKYKMFLEGV